MIATLLVQADMIDEARAQTLHLIHGLGLQTRKIIETEECNQRDYQADDSCNECFSHASSYRGGVDDSLASDNLESPHHADDRPYEPEQGRGSDGGFQHP